MVNDKTPKSKTRLYGIYSGMKQRCYNENNPSYEHYGGKGITICDEWLSSFDAFKEWAEKHGYNEDLPHNDGDKQPIDRINPAKGYCPENCRWISARENASRASLARDMERWRETTYSGVKKHVEQCAISRRVEYVEHALRLLPYLSEWELKWLTVTMEKLIECKEMGFDSSKYFEHGFKPYK